MITSWPGGRGRRTGIKIDKGLLLGRRAAGAFGGGGVGGDLLGDPALGLDVAEVLVEPFPLGLLISGSTLDVLVERSLCKPSAEHTAIIVNTSSPHECLRVG